MNKFELIFKHSCGDCTCNYDIRFEQEMTLEDMVSEILLRDKEWGTIWIQDINSSKCKLEYKHGLIVENKIPRELMSICIDVATANGGWSAMNYSLSLKREIISVGDRVMLTEIIPFYDSESGLTLCDKGKVIEIDESYGFEDEGWLIAVKFDIHDELPNSPNFTSQGYYMYGKQLIKLEVQHESA